MNEQSITAYYVLIQILTISSLYLFHIHPTSSNLSYSNIHSLHKAIQNFSCITFISLTCFYQMQYQYLWKEYLFLMPIISMKCYNILKYQRKMLVKLFYLFVLAFVLLVGVQGAVVEDLMCDGDFESYAVYYLYEGADYGYVNNNPNCWYAKLGSVFQAKKYRSPLTTKGTDLTILQPATICQTRQLDVSKTYNLTYGLYCPPKLSAMTLRVWLNGVQVTSLYISTQNTFLSGSMTIAPSQTSNEICFNENHTLQPFYLAGLFIGGVLDNVSLIEIGSSVPTSSNNSSQLNPVNTTEQSNTTNTTDSANTTNNTDSVNTTNTTQTTSSPNSVNTTNLPASQPVSDLDSYLNQQQYVSYIFEDQTIRYVVLFQKIVEERFSRLRLISNTTFNQYHMKIVTEHARIYISKEEQKDLVFKKNEDGNLEIEIGLSRSYDMTEVEVYVSDFDAQTNHIQFEVYVDGTPIYFNVLSQNDQMIIDNVEPVAMALTDITRDVYLFVSSSMSTIFIFSLFSFWNLSLMYNFLIIRSVPIFTRKIYEIMISILYEQSSLLTWLIKTLSLPENTFDADFESKIDENMNEFELGYSWFGSYGFSSKFFQNNTQNFFGLSLLCLKLLFLKIFLFFLCKKIKLILQIKVEYRFVFLIEGLALAPFFQLSAYSSLLSASIMYLSKLEKSFHVLILFACFCILPIWLTLKYQVISSAKHKQMRNINIQIACLYPENIDEAERMKDAIRQSQYKKIVKETQAEKIDAVYEVAEMISQLTIPFFVFFQNIETFFTIHFCILAYRGYFLVRYWKLMEIKEKVFRWLILLIWIAHNLSFIILYIADGLTEQMQEEDLSRIRVRCGLLALITLVSGGVVQILKFFLETILFIIRILKRIYQYCKRSTSITPTSDKKQIQVISNDKKQQVIQKANFSKEITQVVKKSIIFEDIAEQDEGDESMKKDESMEKELQAEKMNQRLQVGKQDGKIDDKKCEEKEEEGEVIRALLEKYSKSEKQKQEKEQKASIALEKKVSLNQRPNNKTMKNSRLGFKTEVKIQDTAQKEQLEGQTPLKNKTLKEVQIEDISE